MSDSQANDPQNPTPEPSVNRFETVGSIDEFTSGDKVEGDKVEGDKVTGHKYAAEQQIFGEQRSIHTQNYTEKIIDQRIITDSISIGRISQRRLIPPPPPAPRRYIARPKIEEVIRAALSDNNDTKPVTFISGVPGSGKRTLALVVVNALYEEGMFLGGVIWVDAQGRTTDELMKELLTHMGESELFHSAGVHTTRLWQILNERVRESDQKHSGTQKVAPQRTLVVLKDPDSVVLQRLLPSEPTQCRLLILGQEQLQERAHGHMIHQISVGTFEPKECTYLFENLLGEQIYRANKSILDKIAKALDYLPTLVSSAATQFADGVITPQEYLRRLNETTNSALLPDPAWQALDLAIDNLKPEEAELFSLIGLFGSGDWSAEMLAGAALAPVADVRQRLEALVRRELLEQLGIRFRVRPNLQRVARKRLDEWPAERRDVAWNLLARYCLDLIQDRASELGIGPQLLIDAQQSTDIVRKFRGALAQELPHIRRVLDWAAESHSWHITRRFTYLPFASIYATEIANTGGLMINLSLATITRLFVGFDHSARIEPLQDINSGSIVWIEQNSDESQLITSNDDERAEAFARQIRRMRLPKKSDDGVFVSELCLDLAAVAITALSIRNTDVLSASLIGVRAEYSAWYSVTMVGANLLSCDLPYSVWCDVNLSQSRMTDTNLAHAVLRNVRIRKADLRRVNFAYATLHDVDFRDADLSGANFTGARFNSVNLWQAKLDDVIWQGVDGNGTIDDDEIDRIRDGARQPIPGVGYAFRLQNYGRGIDVISLTDVNGHGDFRAGSAKNLHIVSSDLNRSNFSGLYVANFVVEDSELNESQMRGSLFETVRFEGVKMKHADLCLIQIQQGLFDEVTFNSARLQYARLSKAVFTNTSFVHADLIAAHLVEIQAASCDFTEADLSAADLRKANLAGVNFRSATLVAANLSEANLRNASLIHANLRFATLTGANLRGADLGSVDLYQANLCGANLHGALIDIQVLASVANLDEVILPSGRTTKQFNEPEQVEADQLQFAKLKGQFSGIDLSGFDLCGARLDGDFSQINFTSANLTYARIQGSLAGANLTNAVLNHATISSDLTDTQFIDAQLEHASFHNCVINCDLTNAYLLKCNLEGTVWPIQYPDLVLHDTNLTGAILGGGFGGLSLHGSNLSRSVLSGQFSDVVLIDVNLKGAVLSGQFGNVTLVRVKIDITTVFSGQFGDIQITDSDFYAATISGEHGDIIFTQGQENFILQLMSLLHTLDTQTVGQSNEVALLNTEIVSFIKSVYSGSLTRKQRYVFAGYLQEKMLLLKELPSTIRTLVDQTVDALKKGRRAPLSLDTERDLLAISQRIVALHQIDEDIRDDAAGKLHLATRAIKRSDLVRAHKRIEAALELLRHLNHDEVRTIRYYLQAIALVIE